MTATTEKETSVMFAAPKSHPRKPAYAETEEEEGVSLSSCDSNSSNDFVEDSTSGVSSSKRSSSITQTTSHWFDDNAGTARSSTLVLVLVVLTSIILGSVMYVVGKNQQERQFHNTFEDASGEIIQVVHERARSFTSSLHRISLGITFTDAAVNNGEEDWPLYTMQDLDVFAQDLLDKDPRILLAYAPLVSQEYRPAWEKYSVANQELVTTDFIPEDPHLPIPPRPNISQSIFRYDEKKAPIDERLDAMGPFSPVWQFLPVPSLANISVVNLNLLSNDIFSRLAEATIVTRTSVVSELEEPQEILGVPVYPDQGYQTGPKEDPQKFMVQPIFANVQKDAHVVGHLVATQPWESIVGDIIDEGGNDVEIHLVVADSCTSRSYTYWINGNETDFVGPGDLHETIFDGMKQSSVLASYTLEGRDNATAYTDCVVDLSIYPTSRMEANFSSGAAIGYLLLVIALAVILIMAFTTHNKAIAKQQHLQHLKTQRSNAIIASLFPEQIRKKLFGDDGSIKDEIAIMDGGAQQNLEGLLKNKEKGILGFDDDSFEDKQVADLYPNCTVVFADICGFTAWSSTREPAQVFNLLETLFRSFDEIAKRRRAFKVETIGDCYLAVAGLPSPRRDHALVMARFARDILEKFHQVTRMLEVTLGPDTGELGLRIGMHSGPITAGVLRGDKGRFQVFGDTVNTSSRLESTGVRNKIQISKDTVDLLRQHGKGNWAKPRGELVQAKGKGTLETFWLLPKSATRSSVTRSTGSHVSSTAGSCNFDNSEAGLSPDEAGPTLSRKEQSEAKLDRLIFWVSESLLQSLRQVVARRNANAKPAHRGPAKESVRELEQRMSKNKIALDEVREVIALPKYDAEAANRQVDPKTVNLGENVETQLREYITVIASLYQANPFHNFHHASHVTMSMMKLLSRIVAPENVQRNSYLEKAESVNMHENLHDYTYGITSDPLTQFAVIFSAVIHDVDHRGISNMDLCKENEILARVFDRKSVAEQNSIDLAYCALMDPCFQDLRDCIYTDATELRRFRQLVVNCVLATDIFDKDLSALRKKRWDRAFEVSDKDATQEDIHRKAIIVIEHLIQASDVAHTMQHWQVYLKWNEHLFEEQYTSFLQGRNTGKDPSLGWYKGELWFYDNYVIPLAKKLKDCGVFGVSSDECLSYALMNRKEWEKRGEDVVARFVQKYGEKHLASKEKGGPPEEASIATTLSCASDSDPSHQSDLRNNKKSSPQSPIIKSFTMSIEV